MAPDATDPARYVREGAYSKPRPSPVQRVLPIAANLSCLVRYCLRLPHLATIVDSRFVIGTRFTSPLWSVKRHISRPGRVPKGNGRKNKKLAGDSRGPSG